MRAVAANLLMDMVEQCGLVTVLYDQHSSSLRSSCVRLVQMYREAVEEGIHENIMDGILARNLPADLVINLEVRA